MAKEGHPISVAKACHLAGLPRRTFYYQSRRRQRRINEALAARVKRVIDTLPYAGYRTRVQSLPSAASRPNERWATDMARVWCGEEHRWCALTVVMDCFTRELLGWRLSRTGNAKAAEAALEEALINRYGVLGRAQDELTIRSDNGLVFCSRRYTQTVYRYGIKQEFIRPHTPQQNGMVERLIRSVKEQCLWLHNFESLEEARQALRAWFGYYNDHRPHQALNMKTPRLMYQLAA